MRGAVLSLMHRSCNSGRTLIRSFSVDVKHTDGAQLETEEMIKRIAAFKRKPRSQKSKAQWAFAFGVPILTTFGLGCWQAKRLEDKYALISERRSLISMEPISLDQVDQIERERGVESSEALEYRRVSFAGHLLHNETLLVHPRSAPKQVPTRIQQWGGSTGAYVVTPLAVEIEERNRSQISEARSSEAAKPDRIILVNRGWIPHRMQTAPKSGWDELSAKSDRLVAVEGIIRTGDKRNRHTPPNHPEKNQWHWIDVDAITAAVAPQSKKPLLLVDAIELDSESPSIHRKLLDEYLTFYTKPETHIEYMVTWFVLCAVLCAWAFNVLRKQPSTKGVRRR